MVLFGKEKGCFKSSKWILCDGSCKNTPTQFECEEHYMFKNSQPTNEYPAVVRIPVNRLTFVEIGNPSFVQNEFGVFGKNDPSSVDPTKNKFGHKYDNQKTWFIKETGYVLRFNHIIP